MKKYFILFFSLISFSSSAQFIIDASIADVIVYDDYGIELYKKIGKDKFIPVYLEIEMNEDNVFSTNIFIEEEDKEDFYTLEELERDEVLFVKDLATFSEEKFINYLTQNQWIVEDTIIENEREQVFFSAFNRDAMTVRHTKFSEDSRVFLREYIKEKKGKRWIIDDLKWYQTIVLSFEDNKYIALFSKYDGIEGMFLPLKDNKNKLIYNRNILSVLPTKISKEQKNERTISAHFDDEYFYKTVKNTNGKYQLLTNYGKKVIQNEYDTIIYNKLFFVCKNNETEKIDIYKSTLEKIYIPNLKSAYPLINGLEVLTDKGVFYYDWQGKKVKKLTGIYRIICDSGGSTLYQLGNLANSDSTHFLSIENDYPVMKYFALLFPALPISYQISFLSENHQLNLYESDNDFPLHLLKVKSKDKYGLFSYKLDIQNVRVDTIVNSEYINAERYYGGFNCQITPTKEILPIVYDSMVLGGANKLVFLYQDNKIGIYPNFEKPVFDKVERKTPSFYAILRNGKKGWLDINTFKEYYFD